MTCAGILTVSPGVNSSVAGVIGYASKGPVAGKSGEKATLITSQENLIDTFGQPAENIAGQALEGALEILESTNSMYFVRCASSGAVEASAPVQMGYCPAVSVSTTPFSEITGNYAGDFGTEDANVSAVRFLIDVYDHNGSQIVTSKTFDIPSGTVNSAATGGTAIKAMQKVIGGSLDADRVGAFGTNTAGSAMIVGLGAGSGAYMNVTMSIQDVNGTYRTCPAMAAVDWFGVGGSGSVDYDLDDGHLLTSGATASGGTFNDLFYFTRSLYPGAGYNEGTTAGGDTSGNSVQIDLNGAANVILQTNDGGNVRETFKAGATSSVFLENTLGKTVAARTSDHVIGFFTSSVWGNYPVGGITALPEFYTRATSIGDMAVKSMSIVNGSGTTVTTADPRFVKPVQGTYSLSAGNNGIPTDSAGQETLLIGTVESDGGRTGIEALDDESVPVKIALIPDFSELDGAQNALITKAEATQKFLALISPPYAVGKVQDAIDWSNGQSSDRTAAVNSSYAACYWPWVKTFSVYDGKDRWFAPEIYGARQMGVTDAVARPWFAPAGLARGRLTKPVDVEVVLNQGDRDSLYSGGNIINPVTKFDQDGIVIFGQRTTQRKSTALDRINVRRLMIDLRDVVLKVTRQFAFEPNDRFTWERVATSVGPLLDEIKRERGINEFKVICDETTNTPIRVDRNELWCKVLLKPTKTAEIIVFEVNITNQSAQIGN